MTLLAWRYLIAAILLGLLAALLHRPTASGAWRR